ncbi:MAG: 2-succinyl-5-enolpyruvyl-6-hydroxy-3-cyclohexene-1-carboxylic-acid synthase, partial [Flavobacteriales bacterium]|nr:2-succinyl-5-enolpyruvyl-6-hydroxy-3-cyclohexene-1-carboxylic-acid synthase [Flavobacteriales bacterium]
AVRYVQLFENRKDISYFGNRGVSGIEGCTSTALGMATQTEKEVVLLTGDMAFRYDGNAFWNSLRPSNLKCVVFNNQGGGIFRIIPGPDSTDHLESAFEAHQENSARALAEIYDIKYFSAGTEAELNDVVKDFFKLRELAILEIFTPREKNADILRAYFDHLAS